MDCDDKLLLLIIYKNWKKKEKYVTKATVVLPQLKLSSCFKKNRR